MATPDAELTMDALWRITYRPRGFHGTTLDLREGAALGPSRNEWADADGEAAIRRAGRMGWYLGNTATFVRRAGWWWYRAEQSTVLDVGPFRSRRLAARAFARGEVDSRVNKQP